MTTPEAQAEETRAHEAAAQEANANALRERLDAVRERMATAAARVGRRAEEVTLISVSKTHPASVVRDAVACGAFDLGENRVQEAEEKRAEFASLDERLASAARWHLIGHLQANKARRAVKIFDSVHSLDSFELARRLNRLCVEEKRAELPVLIQVDLAGEATKSGVREEDLPALVEAVNASERLRLGGLMILPPFFDDAELVRPYFQRLRELRDELQRQGAFQLSKIFGGAGALSMGMSHDFEIAIEEGATHVRVGTAIFGQR